MANTLKVALFVLFSVGAFAQGGFYANFTWSVAAGSVAGQSSTLVTQPGAAIHVCVAPANATPCTNYASIYSDSALTVPITQPGFVSDAYGNFGFYAHSGNFQYTTTYGGASSGPYPVTMPIASGDSATFTSVSSKNIETVRYADQFSGADCGAKMNAADADLGASVGEIWVNSSCGVISTAPVIAANHTVRFLTANITMSTTWTIAVANRIIGNNTRIHFTGTGKILYLHGGVETDNLHIEGLVLQGNAAATYGIYSDTLFARGEISIINIQDVTTACGYLADIQLMNEMNLTCSALKASLMGVAQTTTPGNGFIFGDTALPFANNRIVNVSAEGTGGIGVWCKLCSNGNVFYGTAEANAGPNMQIEAASINNTLSGFDTEGAGNSIDIIDKGSSTHYINPTSTTSIHLTGAGSPIFDGGITNDYLDDGNSKNVVLRHPSYGNFGGTITTTGNDSNWSFENPFHANVPAVSETLPFRVTMLDLGSPANTDNFEWVPEFTGAGYLELFKHTPNQTAHLGTRLLQFTSSNNAVFAGSVTAPTGVQVGTSGSLQSQVLNCGGAITPASVNATTCAEQTFTIAACSGLATTDTIKVNQSAANTTLAFPVGDWRVSSAGVIARTYCNPTAGALTPTAQTLKIWATH